MSKWGDRPIEAMRVIAERPHLINSGDQAIAQIDQKEHEALYLATLKDDQQRKYGSTILVFYQVRPSS